MLNHRLDEDDLRAAQMGYAQTAEHAIAKIREIEQQLSPRRRLTPKRTMTAAKPKKRSMQHRGVLTPAGRRRIALATKKRWDKWRKSKRAAKQVAS